MPERIQLRRQRGWRKPEGAVVVARPSKLMRTQVLDCPEQPVRVFAEVSDSYIAGVAQGTSILRRSMPVVPTEFLGGVADFAVVEHRVAQLRPPLSLPLLRANACVLVTPPPPLTVSALDESHRSARCAASMLRLSIDIGDAVPPLGRCDEFELPVSAEAVVADLAIAPCVGGLIAPVEHTKRGW